MCIYCTSNDGGDFRQWDEPSASLGEQRDGNYTKTPALVRVHCLHYKASRIWRISRVVCICIVMTASGTRIHLDMGSILADPKLGEMGRLARGGVVMFPIGRQISSGPGTASQSAAVSTATLRPRLRCAGRWCAGPGAGTLRAHNGTNPLMRPCPSAPRPADEPLRVRRSGGA